MKKTATGMRSIAQTVIGQSQKGLQSQHWDTIQKSAAQRKQVGRKTVIQGILTVREKAAANFLRKAK